MTHGKAAVVRLTDEQRADLTRRLEREASRGGGASRSCWRPTDNRRTPDRRRHGAALSTSNAYAAFRREGLEAASRTSPQRRPASWTANRRPDCRLGLLGRSRRARGVDGRLLANRAVAWRSWSRFPNRPCVGCLKKRAQAVAEAVVVHPKVSGEFVAAWRTCWTCTRNRGRDAACGLHGRAEQGAARPGGRSHPAVRGGRRRRITSTSGTGLATCFCCPSPVGLASFGSDGTARLPGIRPTDEGPRGCPLSEGGDDPGGVGQPEHPRVRGVVRGVHAGGGAADRGGWSSITRPSTAVG